MMRQWEHARLSKVFIRRHPDTFQEFLATSTPELRDVGRIPALFSYYLEQYPVPSDNKEEVFLHKLTFISSILRLFCPSALFFDLRVTGNIITTLTEAMEYNHKQSLSWFVPKCRAYIKNKRFAERVEALSEDLKGEAKRLQQESGVSVSASSIQYSFGF